MLIGLENSGTKMLLIISEKPLRREKRNRLWTDTLMPQKLEKSMTEGRARLCVIYVPLLLYLNKFSENLYKCLYII